MKLECYIKENKLYKKSSAKLFVTYDMYLREEGNIRKIYGINNLKDDVILYLKDNFIQMYTTITVSEIKEGIVNYNNN